MSGEEFVPLSLVPLLTGICVAVACALPGNFLVLRSQALIGDAISHVVLPGIVVAYLVTGTVTTWPMLLGAAAAAIVAVVAIEAIRCLGRIESGAAMGVVNTSQWNKDIDNPTNAAFVSSFEAEYGRLPSLYASQGFDTANLLISALEAADPSDADAFREALRAAKFDSTRGDFAFGPNHHPVQTIYAREVVKEGDVFTNKIIGTALENHSDAYAADCKM